VHELLLARLPLLLVLLVACLLLFPGLPCKANGFLQPPWC
jgi:hypothetical protein